MTTDALREALKEMVGLVLIKYGNLDGDVNAAVARAEAALSAPAAPIPMLLFCPKCGMQHVDGVEETLVWSGGAVQEPQDSVVTWDNPPHRSHLCHGCGHICRPCDRATVGVAAIETAGKADGDPRPVELARLRAADDSRRAFLAAQMQEGWTNEQRIAIRGAADLLFQIGANQDDEQWRLAYSDAAAEILMNCHPEDYETWKTLTQVGSERYAAEQRARKAEAKAERLRADRDSAIRLADRLTDQVVTLTEKRSSGAERILQAEAERDAAVARAERAEARLSERDRLLSEAQTFLENHPEDQEPGSEMYTWRHQVDEELREPQP